MLAQCRRAVPVRCEARRAVLSRRRRCAMPPTANGTMLPPISTGYRARSASAATQALEPELAGPGPAPQLDVPSALKGPPLRFLFVAAEGVPYAKTGGLADVIRPLPKPPHRLPPAPRLTPPP